jgi:hypothetical protein
MPDVTMQRSVRGTDDNLAARATTYAPDFPRSGSWAVLGSATCRLRNAAQCGR